MTTPSRSASSRTTPSPVAARLAAIDIGTVTARLLVADVSAERIEEIERSTDITHLGEGLGTTGRLSDDAMSRVAEIMRRYRERMDALGVEHLGAVATSASRDAANSAEFLGLLERSGIAPEIIEGSREAQLTFCGATWEIDGAGVLVDDIGGGSTELVLGASSSEEPAASPASTACRIGPARSIDVGSRRLTERFFASDPPAQVELEAARASVRENLRPFFEALARPPRDVVSVAGTATSLAAIGLGLEVYDPASVHGLRLPAKEVSAMLRMLASLPLSQRERVVGLHPGRAPVIVAGALILEAVLELAHADSTRVSEHDILYGILLDVFGTAVYPNWYRRGP